MPKVYYVMIKGRTLESRNLKELLARAVSEKRKMHARPVECCQRPPAVENLSGTYAGAYSAAVL